MPALGVLLPKSVAEELLAEANPLDVWDTRDDNAPKGALLAEDMNMSPVPTVLKENISDFCLNSFC